MILAKKSEPFWDETSSIDDSLDWHGDLSADIQLIDCPTLSFLTDVDEAEQTYNYGFGFDEQLESSKQQIRNHDCMWSGSCADQSHPGKMGCRFNSHSTNHTESAQEQNYNTATVPASIQQKPILTPNSTLNINNNAAHKIAPFKAHAAQIPAGRSLLIPRNNKLQQPQVNRVPTISTTDFLRERDGPLALHTRPDTPLSLDEDPPEFKHTIDLATCTIGSNQLRLTDHCNSRHFSHHGMHHDDASSLRIINMIKEVLEDNGSDSLQLTRSSSEIGSLTDLLNDLEEMKGEGHEDSDTESNDADGSSSWSSGEGGGDREADVLSGGYTHVHHQEMSPSSSSSSPASSSAAYEYHQGTHVGDHSYTRPKNRYSITGLGVQTPSDSEEEIDVVSIGEKNLPTNPTARDRRALQNRVAHKIARKQQQQQQVSGSQHHHRRRHSDDDLAAGHHSASSSQTGSPAKYNTGAGYNLSPNYLTPASSTTISGTNTPLPGHSSSIANPRKRPSKEEQQQHRGGKSRHHHQHRNKKQRIPGKKPVSDSSEELETLEKRNLHNDMERQRRIGLKNLFEELKRQIPNLREKERAPKVNILREAANLCQRLNREQEQLNALRKQQQRLYARVRQLRTSLHSQRRSME